MTQRQVLARASSWERRRDPKMGVSCTMERRFACAVDDLAPGSSMTVRGEPDVALFRNEAGDFFATEDNCTHEDWSLGTDSDLDDEEVTCPLHMARYDIKTGRPLCFPATVALQTFEVEVEEDGRVFVLV
jgi:nitrite reductase/ring-hydroxylating ferredoxin subunit